MGAYTACADDHTIGPFSVHRYRRVCFWLDPGSLVFREGVDVVPEGSARGAWGTRAMRDFRVERDVDGIRPWGDQQSLRGQRGGAGSMTLVRGHHTLLWWWVELILMIYAIIWRQCYRMCLRACGYASRMRDS
jgi:hypothetical protein